MPAVGRVLTALLALAGTAAGLAGCTGGTPALPADRDVVPTIRIVSGSDSSIGPGNAPAVPDETGIYQQLVAWWEANPDKHPHIHLQLVLIPGGADVVHSEMLASAQSGGSGPSGYDIYNLDSQWIPEFAAGKLIRPIGADTGDTSGYLPLPLATTRYQGRLYGLPFTTDAGLLYYRTDLVSAGQVASVHSVADLERLAAATVKAHPGTGLTDGYVGQFAPYEGASVNALELIRSEDPEAFNTDGTVRSQAALSRGLDDLASLFTSSTAAPAEGTYQEDQALRDFETGRALFMRGWPIAYDQVASYRPTSDDRGPGGTAPVPVAQHFAAAQLPFPTTLGGQDLAVSSSSPNARAALQVIQWLTDAASERCLYAVGGLAPTRAAALDAGALPTAAESRCGSAASPHVAPAPIVLAALGRALPRPTTRYYTEWSRELQITVGQVVQQASSGATGHTAQDAARLRSDLDAAARGAPPTGS
ncbi:extracellular solute-binding protein [Streptacidiphilus carbonis]|uniref:extracellular solute-binding protein n=1 Tax=Streptacidiphilus carbonis TaxID=105422 RepID=UPI0005AA2729|nr:extracellular solute-binding protein [Streptacidiphilus carbonis]